MIHVENISKTFLVNKRTKGAKQAFKSLFKREYKEAKALEDISFHVDEGEIIGYIGPNGAGKSTSIKIMCGILVPDGGECKIMNYTPWKERHNYVKNIGVVFGQRTQLWWDVPVIDSFELLKDIYNIPSLEYKKNFDMLTDSLNLSDFINTPLRQLSLGQRMRCEIVASLLHGPKLLFLDEPTIGLDAVSKLAVRQFIKTINKEKGVTCILTTHDMNDIEALTDRIILIGKGKILHDGSLTEIRSKYDNARTLSLSFKPALLTQCPYGTSLISASSERAVLSIDMSKTTVSKAVASLGETLELLDMTVENKPVEEIIAELYKEYKI